MFEILSRKLGIQVAKSTVETYRVKPPKQPSPTWNAFLENHLKDLVALDFFVVPTVNFKILFVLVVLAHDRHRVIHFNVTKHPTAQWTAQQLVEAFPWESTPKYLLRDRDGIYGEIFRRRVASLAIQEVVTAPKSPWQNPYAERMVGSIRRDCLDQVIILNERHLKRTLKNYFVYYHRWRTHLGLGMDTPNVRPVHPPDLGEVIEIADLGGLHHHYLRRAA